MKTKVKMNHNLERPMGIIMGITTITKADKVVMIRLRKLTFL